MVQLFYLPQKKGLVLFMRLQLRINTRVLVTFGGSFLDIVNHAHSLEKCSHEAQEGSDKCVRREGEFNGSWSCFKVLSDRPSKRGQQGKTSRPF